MQSFSCQCKHPKIRVFENDDDMHVDSVCRCKLKASQKKRLFLNAKENNCGVNVS